MRTFTAADLARLYDLRPKFLCDDPGVLMMEMSAESVAVGPMVGGPLTSGGHLLDGYAPGGYIQGMSLEAERSMVRSRQRRVTPPFIPRVRARLP